MQRFEALKGGLCGTRMDSGAGQVARRHEIQKARERWYKTEFRGCAVEHARITSRIGTKTNYVALHAGCQVFFFDL